MHYKILVVDDHKEITSLLSTYLTQNSFIPTIASDGRMALDLFRTQSFDMILLDVMLPYVDGYTLLQTIRQTSTIPIMMITAKGEEGDRLMGLEYGADDYIVKPFSPREVIARIHAILRRVTPSQSTSTAEITYKSLSINMDTYTVTSNHQPLPLTRKELDLLYIFLSNPNRVFSRDELLDAVWGYDYYGDIRTVDTHIKRLRAKLSTQATEDFEIKTIWGVGYKFETHTP